MNFTMIIFLVKRGLRRSYYKLFEDVLTEVSEHISFWQMIDTYIPGTDSHCKSHWYTDRTTILEKCIIILDSPCIVPNKERNCKICMQITSSTLLYVQ